MKKGKKIKKNRLLTLNCHEAWVYQLSYLPAQIDIIDGLPNRYTAAWDKRMRPVPANARLISFDQALSEGKRYDCIITHNITDMMDVKGIPGPRILVLHGTLDARMNKETDKDRDQIRAGLEQYLHLVGGHVVAVSESKRKSWGLKSDVVLNGVKINDYPAWEGNIPVGIRVANQISLKQNVLLWKFHEEAFKNIPIKIMGYNPDMPGIEPAAGWNDLKNNLKSHRFFVHTADPALEDGFNMAVFEAMAAGLPIIGNQHPTSPITHGVNGYLASSPQELAKYALRLINDRQLAMRMGSAARDLAKKKFSSHRFARNFQRAIKTAKKKYKSRSIKA